MSLKKKTITGVAWTFSQQFSVQLINFAVQMVLARLLLPEEFGLVALLNIFVAVGLVLMDSGLTSSLIRTADADHDDYSTVFTVNLAVSILIYLVLFALAPLFARFFDQPALGLLIRCYTITFVIQAFIAVQTTILTKKMKFKVQMLMEIPSVIGGAIFGILLAYLGYGVWSLVWMNVGQRFLFAVQHWFYSKWRPTLSIRRSKFKKHFYFGYKLALAGLLNAVFDNIYNIVIGKFFSMSQLGFYNRANALQKLPVQKVATALDKVTYPMFSKIQADETRLRMAYKKLMQQVMFWVAPVMSFSAALAYPLITLVYSEKWAPAVPLFQILCVSAVLYPVHSFNLNILRVKGKSALILKLNIVKKITLGALVAGTIYFGLEALLWGGVLSSVIAFFYNSYYTERYIGYTTKKQVLDILTPIALSFLTGVLVWFCNNMWFHHYGKFWQLLIGFGMGLTVYLGVSFLLKVDALQEVKALLATKFKTPKTA